jgi:hypothetical protein
MPLARPIILNGIEDVITRPDLADRAIFVTLPHVQEERRRAEKEIWCDFESAQPHILGALLDAASHGLRALPKVRLEQLPRMADFALWATACESAFCPAGGFLHAYKATTGPSGPGMLQTYCASLAILQEMTRLGRM